MVPPSSLHQQQHPDILVLPHSKAALQSARSSSDDFTIGTRPCSADEQQQQLDDDDAAGVCKEPFTPSMVAAGLSQLGRAAASGGGCSPVFQRLDIANTDLATPAPLAHCQHLQVLVLHHNALTTLASLSALRHLTRLQASHNRLTQVRVVCRQCMAALQGLVVPH
jgi:Leucine-rich repeat (LRR) protein